MTDNSRTVLTRTIASEIIRLHLKREHSIPDLPGGQEWRHSADSIESVTRITDEGETDIHYITDYRLSFEGSVFFIDDCGSRYRCDDFDISLLKQISDMLSKLNQQNESSDRKTYIQMLSELKGWKPASRIVTSKEEIQMLSSHFGMEQMTVSDLRNLRDMTVMFLTRNDRDFDTMQAMMSITAVIDHFILRKGYEV